MAKKSNNTEHFEVSFVDAMGDRRVALAHSAEQAAELAKGFEDEREVRSQDPSFSGLEDIQVHKITTTREPHNVG